MMYVAIFHTISKCIVHNFKNRTIILLRKHTPLSIQHMLYTYTKLQEFGWKESSLLILMDHTKKCQIYPDMGHGKS